MERRHTKLGVWQDAMQLVAAVYELCNQLPNEEKFGLISQMQRAAVSIPSNIAEGAARESDREFLRYLYIARGSLAELETQILISEKLKFITHSVSLNELTNCVFAKLAALINKLKRDTGVGV